MERRMQIEMELTIWSIRENKKKMTHKRVEIKMMCL
jgi:hypothetical protein